MLVYKEHVCAKSNSSYIHEDYSGTVAPVMLKSFTAEVLVSIMLKE